MKKSVILSAAAMLFVASCAEDTVSPGDGSSGKYDVGGHELYISCVGGNDPTVVLESGFGDGGTLSGWDEVRKGVKGYARICLYDRAGLNKSEEGPGPRTTIQIANELHALLNAAGLTGPYVLTGHSMGGLHVQTYAMLYPEDVAAMVLVDPTPAELVDSLTEEALDNLVLAGAPPAVLSEAGEGLDASLSTFRALPSLPDVPVVVITSSFTGEGGVDEEKWEELESYHEALAEQVGDGEHVVATKAGHYIQIDEPDLVIEAIKGVYEKVKE